MNSVSQKEIRLILPDIRSVENVASIFRTADCVGVNFIYLAGVTPGPLDRFGREVAKFNKIALGAEKSVGYERVEDLNALISKLKQEEFEIVALEQDDRSIDYKKFEIKNKTVIIVGTEVTGLPKDTIEKCDAVIEIPMQGEKESLNVSVATAVALFGIMGV